MQPLQLSFDQHQHDKSFSILLFLTYLCLYTKSIFLVGSIQFGLFLKIQSDNFHLLIEMFRPLSFNAIINIVRFEFVIMTFVFHCCLFFVLFLIVLLDLEIFVILFYLLYWLISKTFNFVILVIDLGLIVNIFNLLQSTLLYHLMYTISLCQEFYFYIYYKIHSTFLLFLFNSQVFLKRFK